MEKKIKAVVEFVSNKTGGVCIGKSYFDMEEDREVTNEELGLSDDKAIWLNPETKIKDSAMKHIRKGNEIVFNMTDGLREFKSWELQGNKTLPTAETREPYKSKEKVFLKTIEANTKDELDKKVNDFVVRKQVKSCPVILVDKRFYAFVWFWADPADFISDEIVEEVV